MPSTRYEIMTAGEALSTKDVVYISGNDTVMKVTGSNAAIIGVAKAAISSAAEGSIAVFGRATVVAGGAITAGDLVVGAASGRVVKFTPTATKMTGSHTHSVSVGAIYQVSETDTADVSFSVTSGDFIGGKILGKALTTQASAGGDVDIFISVMG